MATEKLRSRNRSDYGYFSEYKLRWSDNDQYGHMNNVVPFHLFDSVINAYLIEYCGRDPTSSDQIGLVVSSRCDFFSPVAFPAVVDLGLRVSTLGRSSASYEVGIFERGSDQTCAVGGYTHVFVDRHTKKPTQKSMSDEIRRGLSRILRQPSARL